MRLLVVSDLHLEFGPFSFPATLPEFDIAVFAGDVHVPIKEVDYWSHSSAWAGPYPARNHGR